MAAGPSQPKQADEHEDYRPLSGRQRLLIVLLGVGTAIGGVLTLLDAPGGVARKAPPAPTVPTVPECAASSPQSATGCVGGLVTVLPQAAVPAQPTASR